MQLTNASFPAVPPASCAVSSVSLPYWEGLQSGKLMLPHCTSCDRTFFFPRRWCPHCWSDAVTWRQASGEGTLYSRATVRMPFEGRSPDEIPYTVALVDLDEGVRIPGRLHPDAAGLALDSRVALLFPPDPSVALPVWQRAEENS
jgi:uncharacterized OB-fold protein